MKASNHAMEPTPPDLFMSFFAVQPSLAAGRALGGVAHLVLVRCWGLSSGGWVTNTILAASATIVCIHESCRCRLACQQHRRPGFTSLSWPTDSAIQSQPTIVDATRTKHSKRRTPFAPGRSQCQRRHLARRPRRNFPDQITLCCTVT